jgi:DnaJ-class molecular chaperone
MSERYATCRACLGRGSRKGNECSRCGGTGFSGDVFDLIDRKYALKKLNKAETERKTAAEILDHVVSVFNCERSKNGLKQT